MQLLSCLTLKDQNAYKSVKSQTNLNTGILFKNGKALPYVLVFQIVPHVAPIVPSRTIYVSLLMVQTLEFISE